MRKTKICLSLFGVIMLATLFLSGSRLSFAAIISAALHELGHLLAARIRNIPISELRLGIFGARITTGARLISYTDELILAAAGPVSNFLCAFIISVFKASSDCFMGLIFTTSVFLGLLNLLPVNELDGGRIIHCLLCKLLPLSACERICELLSFLSILTLWTLSVYLLLRRHASLSLFLFSAYLFFGIFIRQKN